MLGGFTIETTKSTHKAFRLFGFTCAGVSVLYISIQTVQAILRKVQPGPSRQGKGDGQESEEAQEKEEREILPFSGRFSRQTWPIITVMFYRWELLDLDNRVTVTMGNLSKIGVEENFRFCTTQNV